MKKIFPKSSKNEAKKIYVNDDNIDQTEQTEGGDAVVQMDKNNENELHTNNININDINVNDIDSTQIANDSSTIKSKRRDNIEYYLYDVESLNFKNDNKGGFVDLASIRSNYLSEHKKKKAKKKENTKKGLKIFNKKYNVIQESNLDGETIYEESIQNEKEHTRNTFQRLPEGRKSIELMQKSLKQFFEIDKTVLFDVLKFILLVSSIFSLGAFSTTVTKFVFFVEKFNYSHIITVFQFLIMYLILRLVVLLFKMKSSTNLTRKDYIKYILTIAALLSVDVITGNSAYSYLEIPIITVVKSSSLILIYFLSVQFGLKELKCSLFFSILSILAGTMMSITTLKIDSFFGFCLLMVSVISSSFKWVFTNILLKATSIKPHIILLHIYQIAILIMLLPSLLIDVTNMIKDYNDKVITLNQIYMAMILLGMASLTNIFLILAEFLLISHTSSVTLSIVGIGREAIMLLVGAIFFGEKIGLSASIGVMISMIGTVMYGYASKSNEIK